MFYRGAKASPGKGRWHEVPERFSIAALLRVLKPPLCKGRWHGEAVTEGL
jgi:hypothetical protein